MNSNSIFEYSEDFLNEILNDILNLRAQKMTAPSNNEFENKLKMIVGKNFNDLDFKNLIALNDKDIKEKIISMFKEMRKERIEIIGENDVEDIEKRIFLHTSLRPFCASPFQTEVDKSDRTVSGHEVLTLGPYTCPPASHKRSDGCSSHQPNHRFLTGPRTHGCRNFQHIRRECLHPH